MSKSVTPGDRRPRVGLTGHQLIMALVIIAALSSLLPWAVATRVNASRIARAEIAVRDIAASLRSADLSQPSQHDTVLVGPGADPKIPEGSDWRAVRAVSPSAAQLGFTLPMDPWGNHYVIYPASAAPLARWVLSAGPNGIVETPFRQDPEHAVIGGDDIGFRLR